MAKKKIEITFSPTGETQVKTEGFIGKLCLIASGFLEKALGKATKTEKTADFYKSDVDTKQSIER